MNTAADEQNIKAVYLVSEDLKIAASILYQAYHDDPLFMQIFASDKEGYESRLRSAIREELNLFWRSKQPMFGLFEGERLLAVTCLVTPEAGFGPERFWQWKLKMLLTAGMLSTKQMIEKERLIKECVPETEFHILSFIGVHPDHQHKGLGHMLLAAIDTLMEEHQTSKGIAVYATVPEHVSFFEHGNYRKIKRLEAGNVSGELMFRYK